MAACRDGISLAYGPYVCPLVYTIVKTKCFLKDIFIKIICSFILQNKRLTGLEGDLFADIIHAAVVEGDAPLLDEALGLAARAKIFWSARTLTGDI
jgi:hypothetical protein